MLKFPIEYQNLLDYKRILKNTPNKKNLSVTLKNSPKGVGLYATKPFKKGDTIAYYKVRIFKYKNYISPTDSVYSFGIYRKNGDEYKTLIGDIDLDSFPPPKNNITYWAPFANEPNKDERVNAEVDENKEGNYKNKTYSKAGENAIYVLKAGRDIKKGDEIMWYYGKGYERDYKVGKKK